MSAVLIVRFLMSLDLTELLRICLDPIRPAAVAVPAALTTRASIAMTRDGLGRRMSVRLLPLGTRATPATLPERSEEHTSELQSRQYLVCRLLLEKKKI